MTGSLLVTAQTLRSPPAKFGAPLPRNRFRYSIFRVKAKGATRFRVKFLHGSPNGGETNGRLQVTLEKREQEPLLTAGLWVSISCLGCKLSPQVAYKLMTSIRFLVCARREHAARLCYRLDGSTLNP